MLQDSKACGGEAEVEADGVAPSVENIIERMNACMHACMYACSAAQKDLPPPTQSRPHNETCEFLSVNEEPHYTPVRREDGFTVPLAPLTELKTRIKNVTFSKRPLPLCSFLLQAPSLAVNHQEWKKYSVHHSLHEN